MAKVVSKSPINPEALAEIFAEIGAKEGFGMRASDGDPVVIESTATQEVLEWAVNQAKTRKPKRQLDEELRKSLLAKTSWSTVERDQAIRLLLERVVI